jgi:TetR/AcrR family transcriptional repressor of nem operon
LFNERGYSGASLSDVMKATGLQKGGLYNHFGSKEELAVEAFDYAVRLMNARVETWLAGKKTAPERLRGIVDGWLDYVDNPPVPGGCPLMNTAVDNDDSNPRLRERVKQAMESFLGGYQAIIKGGIKRGELRADVNAKEAAVVLMATFEGGLMLSKLHRDSSHMKQMVAFMRRYIDGMLA